MNELMQLLLVQESENIQDLEIYNLTYIIKWLAKEERKSRIILPILNRASDFHRMERTTQKEIQFVANRCQPLITAFAICLLKKLTPKSKLFLYAY